MAKRRNSFLNAGYLAILETQQGTPYFLNLHHGDVGHSLVLGATGAGKSFFLCFLLMQLQKYAPFALPVAFIDCAASLARHESIRHR